MTVLENYDSMIIEAINFFWETRDTQRKKQLEKEIQDAGITYVACIHSSEIMLL